VGSNGGSVDGGDADTNGHRTNSRNGRSVGAGDGAVAEAVEKREPVDDAAGDERDDTDGGERDESTEADGDEKDKTAETDDTRAAETDDTDADDGDGCDTDEAEASAGPEERRAATTRSAGVAPESATRRVIDRAKNLIER
jgi:hypothetical protein